MMGGVLHIPMTTGRIPYNPNDNDMDPMCPKRSQAGTPMANTMMNWVPRGPNGIHDDG